MKTVLKEWFIQAPWGKIALVSWGDPNGEPVLLVHGRQDSLSTFIPLLELLPDKYHYVAVDLPGNGLSDALPIGVKLTRIFPVVVVEMVAEHMKWDKFIYIGHSMGSEHGLFYNAVHPGKLKKCIYLDGATAVQRLMITDFPKYFQKFYVDYYDNYDRINTDDRIYSKESALKAVMKARNLTKEQAEIILTRNLRRIGDDKYKLSWDKREKLLAPTFNSLDYYYSLFSLRTPPTLHIAAKQTAEGYIEGKEAVAKLLSDLERNGNFKVISVEGGHDVHFTNPERLAGPIISFLQEETVTNGTKSKL